ncbi:MarR family winged helix-turn-helix transcriptional regulator [Hydrogenophaga palleronii]|uniref:MarR family winged helix-turn-helix transcriptional regulator n=1 Tax=Hydrogenophaga palleronii TaxID=65655 RepID=UPI001471519B|nr:winged helix DNA-binding protein [Hydrogenophaga palleronii]
MLDKLDERRLITRTPSEDDRRKRFIALTSKGVALVEEAGRVADHMERELLEHLSDCERASLFRLLKKVTKYRAP